MGRDTDGKLSTEELQNGIRQSADASAFLTAHAGNLTTPTLPSYLQMLIASRDMSPAEAFDRAGIDRSQGYRILAGSRGAGRNMLLRLAFTLGLTVEETGRLLAIGGRGALYARRARDAWLIRLLDEGRTLAAAEMWLQEHGEATLYGTDGGGR